MMVSREVKVRGGWVADWDGAPVEEDVEAPAVEDKEAAGPDWAVHVPPGSKLERREDEEASTVNPGSASWK